MSKPVVLYILIGLVIATFMITPLSRPLWENLPLLSFSQFPWRFLSVQAFFGALVIGGLALLPGRRYIVPVAIGLLLVAGLGNLQPDFLILNDADVTAERLAEYEWYTANIGSTVSAEYLPQTVRPRPFTSPWLNTGERYSIQQLDGQLTSMQLISTGVTKPKVADHGRRTRRLDRLPDYVLAGLGGDDRWPIVCH